MSPTVRVFMQIRMLMQEHLILKQPFYMLHPCQTAEVMAILTPAVPTSPPAKASAQDRTGEADSLSLDVVEGGELKQSVRFLKAVTLAGDWQFMSSTSLHLGLRGLAPPTPLPLSAALVE